MAEMKTRATRSSVPAFLAKVADSERRRECEVVSALMERVTGERPVLWGSSIIGFGRYAYVYESGRSGEWPIVGFSPRKTDLTLYLMPGTAKFPELMAKLGKHRTGKSCLYIKRLSDVDLKVLERLIRKSVEAMEPQRVAPA